MITGLDITWVESLEQHSGTRRRFRLLNWGTFKKPFNVSLEFLYFYLFFSIYIISYFFVLFSYFIVSYLFFSFPCFPLPFLSFCPRNLGYYSYDTDLKCMPQNLQIGGRSWLEEGGPYKCDLEGCYCRRLLFLLCFLTAMVWAPFFPHHTVSAMEPANHELNIKLSFYKLWVLSILS